MSKEEVYKKAKRYIDEIYTPELEKIVSKLSLIKSFAFLGENLMIIKYYLDKTLII